MSRRRVPWDGPNPSPGDYLECRHPETMIWRIDAVTPLTRVDISGARLVLDVAVVQRGGVPEGAVVHPRVRATPTDAQGPARVRQLQQGRGAVMRASWRDPDDLRPNARRAREITGWRTFCPLRRMALARGSQIDEQHIVAADLFRLTYDRATIGESGTTMMPIGSGIAGPRSGPAAGALAGVAAARDVQRVKRRFPETQWLMLVFVVLQNRTLAAWCGLLQDTNPQVEMGRLLSALEMLVEHYRFEVDLTLAADRLIVAA